MLLFPPSLSTDIFWGQTNPPPHSDVVHPRLFPRCLGYCSYLTVGTSFQKAGPGKFAGAPGDEGDVDGSAVYQQLCSLQVKDVRQQKVKALTTTQSFFREFNSNHYSIDMAMSTVLFCQCFSQKLKTYYSYLHINFTQSEIRFSFKNTAHWRSKA